MKGALGLASDIIADAISVGSGNVGPEGGMGMPRLSKGWSVSQVRAIVIMGTAMSSLGRLHGSSFRFDAGRLRGSAQRS